MKVQLILFFITSLTIQCIPSTTIAQIPNAKKDITEKAIKEIETYKVNPQSGDKTHVSSEYFNKKGQVIKNLMYDSYSSGGTNEMNCTYDTQGNSKCITKDKSGKQTYFYEKKYEGEHVVEEKTTYETIKFFHDKNGNLLLQEEYDSEGDFSKAEKYELEYIDGTTKIKSENIFEKRGEGEFKLFGKNIYTYDENGKLKTELARTNFYEYHYTYTYYPNGNLKEKITLNGNTEKIITKYHQNGKRRIEAIFRSEEADSEMILVQKNIWTYDKYDNQIMSENFRNDKLVSMKIRKITYY